MAADKAKRDFRDRSKINMHERYEVDYWRERLGVTKERLAEAVQKVGSSVEKVRSYLAGKQ